MFTRGIYLKQTRYCTVFYTRDSRNKFRMETFLCKLNIFKEQMQELELFLEPNVPLSNTLLESTKEIFDCAKSSTEDLNVGSNGLRELIVNDLDDEQVWQQIEIESSDCLERCRGNIADICDHKERFSVELKRGNAEWNFAVDTIISDSEEQVTGDDRNGQVDITEVEEDESFDADITYDSGTDEKEEAETKPKENKVTKKKKSHEVDDRFFKLDDMNAYVDRIGLEDSIKGGNNDSEEEIDLFSEYVPNEIGSDEEEAFEGNVEERNLMYDDFFDPPDDVPVKKRKRKEPEYSGQIVEGGELKSNFEDVASEEEVVADEESESYEEEDNEDEENDKEDEEIGELSRYEKDQAKIQEKIKELEHANLDAKPWQEKGEAVGLSRPINSLLEEHLEFSHTSVGGPAVTEETTNKLEDIIKQRVKDQAWDDVVRKEKMSIETHDLKKQGPLDEEKSKLSLAEIYEKEYLKTTATAETEEEKEKEEHVVIKGMLKRLFHKLDALANYHFTPKPAKEDLQIITNVPSIQVEEVAPVFTSETNQLAPEEVFNKAKTETKGATEKTITDRKRERRMKKTYKRKQGEEKRKKLEATGKLSGDKRNKEELLKSLSKSRRTTIVKSKKDADKHLKSSSAVFARLQDEARTHIQSTLGQKKKFGSSIKKKRVGDLKL